MTPAIVVNDRRWHAKLRNEMQQHPIPVMSDPLGAYWKQPHRSTITIDKTHALMTRANFLLLHDYSGTQPTGAYPGKMWRRLNGRFDRLFLSGGGKPEWLLCWYAESERGPEWMTTHWRKILLSDANIELEK